MKMFGLACVVLGKQVVTISFFDVGRALHCKVHRGRAGVQAGHQTNCFHAGAYVLDFVLPSDPPSSIRTVQCISLLRLTMSSSASTWSGCCLSEHILPSMCIQPVTYFWPVGACRFGRSGCQLLSATSALLI